ncbi:hypothetical protein JWG39_12060 [Desulforhopalus vacuolatus]|uniref:hypothetical protein n=1 Tax=Desulforhopalus vacuolatus TaxID=40414 RepID=UPI001964C3D3|nr:hypothetical protein [Desulforhopalus vacuolatus]MBM9520550.1 hypothetical protein [Desulforhopalus vacuolatus]
MSYQYLSLVERHYIEISQKKEVLRNQRAKDLGCSLTMISHEIDVIYFEKCLGNRLLMKRSIDDLIHCRIGSLEKCVKEKNRVKS